MTSLSTILGNVFIYMLLSQRGPIVLALVTTTRKVISVLLSAHTSATDLYGMEGLGMTVVCLGIIFESCHSINKKRSKEDDEKSSKSKEISKLKEE